MQLQTRILNRSYQASLDAYTKIIETCTRDRAFNSGRVIHASLIINGWACLTHFASKIMGFYVECGRISNARKVFDNMPKSNVRRWITLIGGYGRCGYYAEAIGVFSEMQKEGLRPNKFVLPSILKACGHVCDRQTGAKIHCVVLRCSFEGDAFISSALIDMYSKCEQVGIARKVFDRMTDKDLVALNAMVSGYIQHGFVNEAFGLMEEMKLLGLEPNVVTLNTLICGFSRKGNEEMVCKIIQQMQGNGVEPDVVSWTSIISGFVQNFRNHEAFSTFKQMLNHGICPSSATISCLLPACATLANVRRGKEIHGFAVVKGVEDDIFVKSALVDMYAKCGLISEAKELFLKMSESNTVTWNSMIFAYANHGYCKEAIELFVQMTEVGKKLDYLTFVAVLTACSHAGMIELGKSLFCLMQEKYGIQQRLEHYACMVDLYGRAGKLAEAYDFIKEMPVEPDLFVWGPLLGACRNHGNVELAEVAAKHLSRLEPGSGGSNSLLSSLYADTGNWGNAARLKKIVKKRKLKQFPGCSWVEAA